MGGAKITHKPVIQCLIRGQLSISWGDPCDDEVFACRIGGQADGETDRFAHALTVKGIREVAVVEGRLDIGIWGGKAQFTSTQGELETTTKPNVVGIIIDDHLYWSMLTGHENRGNLH